VSYPIPTEQACSEIEIKKSRFVAYAKHISDRQSAMAWLSDIKAQTPEPSGTAGKPILNVLQHKGVGDIMIIVVRFFGGIKLGAGGLTRAYSQAAQEVMACLPIEQAVPKTQLSIRCTFAQEQPLRHGLNQVGGEVLEVTYKEWVTLEVECPTEELDSFCQLLKAHQCLFKPVSL